MRKRPTAAIMGDDWFGHRNPLTGDKVGDREEYLTWDWALLNAFQTIEDYTDSDSGLLTWEMEGEGVDVDAVRKVNKFLQARDNATKGSKNKPYEPRPGEKWYPRMYSRKRDENGNEVFPTLREWIEEQVAKEQD